MEKRRDAINNVKCGHGRTERSGEERILTQARDTEVVDDQLACFVMFEAVWVLLPSPVCVCVVSASRCHGENFHFVFGWQLGLWLFFVAPRLERNNAFVGFSTLVRA